MQRVYGKYNQYTVLSIMTKLLKKFISLFVNFLTTGYNKI